MTKEEQGKKLGEVIKKAWDDEAYMKRLLDDATTVLQEEGIPVPEGMKVKAVINTKEVSYLLIPSKPQAALSDEALASVAAAEGYARCYYYGGGEGCWTM